MKKLVNLFIALMFVSISTASFGQPVIKAINKSLTLKELDGTGTIISLGKSFARVNDEFGQEYFAGPAIPTKSTPVIVYHIVKTEKYLDDYEDTEISELKSFFPGTWEQMAVSQCQLVEFCISFRNQLKNPGYTYFILKENESRLIDEDTPGYNACIVAVYVYDDGDMLISLKSWREDFVEGSYLVIANNAKIGRKSMASEEETDKLYAAQYYYKEKKDEEAAVARRKKLQAEEDARRKANYNNTDERRNRSVVPKYRLRGW